MKKDSMLRKTAAVYLILERIRPWMRVMRHGISLTSSRLLCLSILFFMLLAGSGCHRAPTLSPLPTNSIVIAFGDSVTYGTGAAKGEDWPAQLGGLTGWRIVNAGIPGDTAEEGKSRISALLDEHRPALVIVEIGGNDFLRRRPPKLVKEDIRQILASIRQSGVKAVLIAVPELSLGIFAGPSDAAIYAELGKEEMVPVIADVFSKTIAQPELRTDPIHPNSKGYSVMAAAIFERLKKIGLVRK